MDLRPGVARGIVLRSRTCESADITGGLNLEWSAGFKCG